MIISVLNFTSDPRKTAFGWYKQDLDLDNIAKIITTKLWSPCVWSGRHRVQKDFLFADFCALDFDTGEYLLEQAIKEWSDSIHIIGITKSHGIEKNGIVADRFRLVTPFTQRIADIDQYKQNIAKHIRNYGADKACKGGAQFFYPCREIVSINKTGFSLDVLAKRQRISKSHPRKLIVPPYLFKFINVEIVPKGSRNNTFFKVACAMLEAKFDIDRIVELILNSPTYQGNLDYKKEIAATVASAAKHIGNTNE